MNTTREAQPTVTAPPAITSTLCLKVMARVYDPFLDLGGLSGMRRRRKALVAQGTGRVLAIGAGTGLNLRHYPDDVSGLILAEPDPAMGRRLERRARRADQQAVVIDAPAQALSVPDGSVDKVVCALALCTVKAPDAASREIARVLAPGGQLLFIAHVPRRVSDARSPAGPPRAALARFRRRCRCNRATGQLMLACGCTLASTEGSWRAMPSTLRPLITGRPTCAAP